MGGPVQPVAFIYDRVVSRTAQSRVALHLRLLACREFAASQEWAIGGWYVDGSVEALADHSRPALDRALLVMGRTPEDTEQYLLVHDLDRVSRTPATQLVIAQRTRLAHGQICTLAGPVDERARQGLLRDALGSCP